jgi:hypothetical protein
LKRQAKKSSPAVKLLYWKYKKSPGLLTLSVRFIQKQITFTITLSRVVFVPTSGHGNSTLVQTANARSRWFYSKLSRHDLL